jgi:hypothetical protein
VLASESTWQHWQMSHYHDDTYHDEGLEIRLDQAAGPGHRLITRLVQSPALLPVSQVQVTAPAVAGPTAGSRTALQPGLGPWALPGWTDFKFQ